MNEAHFESVFNLSTKEYISSVKKPFQRYNLVLKMAKVHAARFQLDSTDATLLRIDPFHQLWKST